MYFWVKKIKNAKKRRWFAVSMLWARLSKTPPFFCIFHFSHPITHFSHAANTPNDVKIHTLYDDVMYGVVSRLWKEKSGKYKKKEVIRREHAVSMPRARLSKTPPLFLYFPLFSFHNWRTTPYITSSQRVWIFTSFGVLAVCEKCIFGCKK